MEAVSISYKIEKADADGRFVRGFASVTSVDGAPVVDWQKDIISIETITKTAHEFVRDARVAKVLHNGEPVGEVVESVIVDEDFVKALGVTDTRRGWWIGMQVHSDAIRKRIKSGELRAFSIGGRGVREEVLI
jgi:hypothetical protein